MNGKEKRQELEVIQHPSENMCMLLLLKAALGIEREVEAVGPLWRPLFSCAAEQPPAGTESTGPAGVRKASEKMYYLACETKRSESQEAKPGSGCTGSKICQSERVLVSIFNSTRAHSSALQETSTVHDQASAFTRRPG